MLYRIAVCDDTKEELMRTCDNLQRYFAERGAGFSYEMDSFSHPDDLLTAAGEKAYHLYLLDILMPMINGVNTAQEIQRKYPDAFFVFISTTTDYSLEAFTVNAIHYLKKPYSFEDFATAMDRFLDRMSGFEKKLLLLQDGSELWEFDGSEVLYISADGKNSLVHFVRKPSVVLHTSLKNLSDLSSPYKGMARLGASYIVNLEKVRRLDGRELLLVNGESLPVPRRVYVEFKQTYMEYFCQ